jgi:glutamate synthase (NADPH/NADH) small chain
VKDESGRIVPKAVENTRKAWKADRIIIAMGFLGPEDTLAQTMNLSRDPRTNVAAANYQTSKTNVFVAGDMHSGQSLVVRAINEGQLAAAACHDYLSE